MIVILLPQAMHLISIALFQITETQCRFANLNPPSFYTLGHAMFPPFQHYLLYNHQICIQTHEVKIILNKLKAINAIPIYCACIILKIILNGSGGVMKSKFKLKRNHLN